MPAVACSVRMRAALAPLAALLLAVPAPAGTLAVTPPVTLVETRPVESRLGDPGLPDAATTWVEMIRGARHTLDLEQFYVSHWPGEPTGPVLDAIGAAAARGVRVRLLIDRGMHATYPMPADSLGRLPGVELRQVDYGRIAGGVQHAKYFLVDGAEVFLGSQNMDWRALKHIHELGVRIRDPRVAAVFQQTFDMDWAAAGRPAADTTTADTLEALRAWAARASLPVLPIVIVQAPGDTVRLTPSYSPRSFIPDPALWDRDAIVRLIDGARRSLVAQVLSYATGSRGERDTAIDEALRRAAARGVRVRLIVSDWESGNGMRQLQALVGVANLAVRISTVPEWSGGYIPYARVEHCKYAVADGARLWLGTSNWAPDYFHGTRNIAVTLENRPLAARAQRIFETSWASPTARPLQAGREYPTKAHGEQSPDGRPVYGR